MTTNFQKVKQFHKAFGETHPQSPQLPSDNVRDLRITLIEEEFNELKEAILSGDLEHIAKEASDLLVVVYGTGDTYGIDLDKAYAEVHRSNMSKLGEDGNPIRREDGKILKGPNYTPADMSVIWEKETKMTAEEKLHKIEWLVKNYIDFPDYSEADGTIDVYGISGGNMDDAFECGASQALGQLSREILDIVKK